MIYINNDLIQKLRKLTGIGIVKCKQALIEANGDMALAIDIIKKSGVSVVAQKSGRVTLSGVIAIEMSVNKQYGVILEINCETDFVAKDNTFQEFVKTVIITALNEQINDINILRIRFETQRINLIAKVGENIYIRRLVVLTGDFLGYYLHGHKIGVIVSTVGNVTTDLMKQLTMHIAARNPKYIDVSDIPEDIINRERNIQIDIVTRSQKPHKILDKIIEGRMNKFISEIVLTQQNFIMDIDKTVGQLLNEYHAKVNNFVRFELGEEI